MTIAEIEAKQAELKKRLERLEDDREGAMEDFAAGASRSRINPIIEDIDVEIRHLEEELDDLAWDLADARLEAGIAS